MLYARGPLRTLQLAAILAIASASSIRPELLLERDSTCAADFTKCPQAGLPSNFCCAKGTSCSVLAGGTTVLCCPEGNDCGTIETISCTISLQDPKANPKAEVKTTELDKKLPTCGKGCCPFGYHCDEDEDNCVKDNDQSKKPGETPSSSSASPSPSPSSSSSSKPHSSTTTAHSSPTTLTTQTSAISTTAATAGGGKETAIPSTETPTTTATQTLNIAAIVGGVVGGIALILLIAGGVWLIRHKRKKAEDELKKHESTSSFGNMISAPIPHADYHTQRLDFLAKAQSSSVAASPTQAQERFPPTSPYSPYGGYGFRPESQMSELPRSQHASPRSYHPSAEIGGLRNLTDRYSGTSTMTASSLRGSNPFTTRSERQHSGGSESINIFADPSTVGTPPLSRDRRDTTWTEFQHHADQRGPESPVRRR